MKNILAILCLLVVVLTCFHFIEFLDTNQTTNHGSLIKEELCEVEIVKAEHTRQIHKYAPLTKDLLLMVEGDYLEQRMPFVQYKVSDEILNNETEKQTEQFSNVDLHKQSMELLKKIREQN